MNKLAIPHDAMIFVGDGRKALFLRNDGDEKFPNLKTEQVFADENPPTNEQGTDKPGSVFARAGAHRRSSVDQTTGITSRSTVLSSASPLRSRAWCAAARSPPSSSPRRRARLPTCAGPFMPT